MEVSMGLGGLRQWQDRIDDGFERPLDETFDDVLQLRQQDAVVRPGTHVDTVDGPVAHHQPIGVDPCAPSPCQEGTQGCASCTWSRGGEPERVQAPALTENGQASCDVITTDGVEDVIDSLSIRCATDHLDEILRMSVDGSSPQGADDVRLGCGCRGPDLRDPRPTTELERGGPHATTTAMDEDPVLSSEMSEVVRM